MSWHFANSEATWDRCLRPIGMSVACCYWHLREPPFIATKLMDCGPARTAWAVMFLMAVVSLLCFFEFAAVLFGVVLVFGHQLGKYNKARFCSVNRRVPLILHIKVLSNGHFFHCRTRSWLHCPWDRVPFGVPWQCPVVMVMWPFMLLSPSQRNAP